MHRVTALDADPFYGPGGVVGIAYGYVPVFDASIDLRIEELDLFKVPRISVPFLLAVPGVDCRPDAQAAEIDFIRLRDFPGFRDELALGRPGRNEFDGCLGPERGGAVIKRDRLYATVRRIWDASPDAFSEERVAGAVSRLEPLTRVDAAAKREHVAAIRERFGERLRPRKEPRRYNPSSSTSYRDVQLSVVDTNSVQYETGRDGEIQYWWREY